MNPLLQQWLLNLAISFPIPLRLLSPAILNGRDDEPHALNVRSLQGFTFEDCVPCLVELAENGLVSFSDRSHRKTAPRDLASLMRRPGAEMELSFKLTRAGGLAWESMAEPRWHDMTDGYGTPRVGDGNLTGLCDWILFSQTQEHLIAELGWYPMLHSGDQINLATVRWSLAANYRVKYWKRLPNVHVVKFRSCLPPSEWRYERVPSWLTSWWHARSNWYRHPWEMGGWPPGRESLH
jgi:hypothetical protein